jgi:hypothetical protein
MQIFLEPGRMSLTGHAAGLGSKKHFSDLGIDGRIILKWVMEKYGMEVWTRFSQLETGSNIVMNLQVL